MALIFTTSYLEDVAAVFRYYKSMAERAIAQVSDEHLTAALDPEMNSIALIVKHLAGNMRSRWSEFLTSDGEKPDRNRDQEFLQPPATRAELLALWENAWSVLFANLTPLADTQLSHSVRIRGEAHSVVQAINRQMTHCSYHCGQIVFLAKHWAHDRWNSLSVPRGQSDAFNRAVMNGDKSQR